MSLKKNIIANYAGQGWSALLNFIFIPIYIKYLGMESYGLVGLFSFLQIALSVLDSGVTPLLTRESARYIAGEKNTQDLRNLLRTLEYISLSIGIVFFLLVYLTSNWIATEWLIVEELSVSTVTEALTISSSVVVLRFFEGFYKGALIGFQKLVTLNTIMIVGNSIRNIGVIFVLHYISSTIQTFFYWQAFSSLLMTISFMFITHKLLGGFSVPSHFSKIELTSNWNFASGTLLSTFLALTCRHFDKLILSKYLTLSEFGNYSLASSVVNVINLFKEPLLGAYYPKLIEFMEKKEDNNAKILLHQCQQLISIICGTALFALIFYGKTILSVWTQNSEISNSITPLIKGLSLSMLFLTFHGLPALLPIIKGKPYILVKISTFSIIIFLLICFPLIINYGLTGAIWSNIIQNLFLFICYPLCFNYYLKEEQTEWLTKDTLKPLFQIIVLFFLSMIPIISEEDFNIRFIWLLFTTIVILSILLLSNNYINKILMQYLRRNNGKIS